MKNITATKKLTDTVQERMLKIELAMQYIAYDIWLCQNYLNSLTGQERIAKQKIFDDNIITKLIENKKLEEEYNSLKFQKKSKKLNNFFDHPGTLFVINQDTALKVKPQKQYRKYLESQAEHVEEIILYIFKEMKNKKFIAARFLDSQKSPGDENLFEKVTIKNAKIVMFDGKDFDCIIVK